MSQNAPLSRHVVRSQKGEITVPRISRGLLTHSPRSATLAPEHIEALHTQCAPYSTAYEGSSQGGTWRGTIDRQLWVSQGARP
jgi:hypothetical protein